MIDKYERIFELLEQYNEIKNKTPVEHYQSFNASKRLDYTYDSTKIEGNTLSKFEIKTILEDKQNIPTKNLREIYEVVNHDNAFQMVLEYIGRKLPLDESIIKDLHYVLTQNIFVGGIYRQHNVYITGASFKPVDVSELGKQLQFFYYDLENKEFKNPIEKAAWIHAEFVKIHPFPDGNGRISRLIMNYELMLNGFPFINIKEYDALRYYSALDEYASKGNLEPFLDLVIHEIEQELHEFIQNYELNEDIEISL